MKYPLGDNVDTINTKNEVNLAIIGFDSVGISIFYRALNLGHFYNHAKLNLTIFNDSKSDVSKVKKIFGFDINKDVLLSKYFKVDFKDDMEIFKNGSVANFDQIIICKQDISENISDALRLYENQKPFIKNKEIFIFIDNNTCISEILKGKKGLFAFGSFDKVCSYDVVVNSTLDKMAKQTDLRYNELHGYDSLNWDELDTFLKESNRMQVEHLNIKLKAINEKFGKQKFDFEEIKKIAKEKWFKFNDNQILWDKIDGARVLIENLGDEILENLVISEKNRWNTFHLLNGWKKIEIPKNYTQKIKKDKEQKLHSCLVEWENLDIVSKNHSHDYKSDDIETITRSYEMLSLCDEEWLGKNSWFMNDNIKIFKNKMSNLKKD